MFRLRPSVFRLTRDTHPKPHLMTRWGGCACTCSLCLKEVSPGWWKCICPRCNETCPSLGRLGRTDQIEDERKQGHPRGGKPARRWYRP